MTMLSFTFGSAIVAIIISGVLFVREVVEWNRSGKTLFPEED